MASRRNKSRQGGPFGDRPEYTPEEAANLIYGDARAIEELDRRRVITRPVALENIIVDQRIQVRVAGLDAEKVESYAVVMAEGGKFPPVVVFRESEDDTAFYLADGFHRVEAAVRADLRSLPAEIHPGGYDAAVEYAEEANLQHGLALSNADKRAIFERRVQRGHEWARLSDRAIAQVLGVDNKTVGNWRRALAGVEFSTPETTVRTGADGKVYNVGGIQKANQQRTKPEPARPQREEYIPSGYEEGRQEEPRGALSRPGSRDKLEYELAALHGVAGPHDDEDQQARLEASAVTLIQMFKALSNTSIEACNAAERLRGDIERLADARRGELYDALSDLFDYLNGYQSVKGKWVPGLLDVLEGLGKALERREG